MTTLPSGSSLLDTIGNTQYYQHAYQVGGGNPEEQITYDTDIYQVIGSNVFFSGTVKDSDGVGYLGNAGNYIVFYGSSENFNTGVSQTVLYSTNGSGIN